MRQLATTEDTAEGGQEELEELEKFGHRSRIADRCTSRGQGSDFCPSYTCICGRVVAASHGDDELPSSMSSLEIPDSLGDLAQRVGPVDDWGHLAGLDELLQNN
jgi:hypothetical protein